MGHIGWDDVFTMWHTGFRRDEFEIVILREKMSMLLLVESYELRHLLAPCDPSSFSDLPHVCVVLNYLVQCLFLSVMWHGSSNSAQQPLKSIHESLITFLPVLRGQRG